MAPEGRQRGSLDCPQVLARAGVRAAPRAGTMLTELARTEAARSGKNGTVDSLMVPARYNFLHCSSRPALRAAAAGGRPRAGSIC
jgi:hypothetical protein